MNGEVSRARERSFFWQACRHKLPIAASKGRNSSVPAFLSALLFCIQCPIIGLYLPREELSSSREDERRGRSAPNTVRL